MKWGKGIRMIFHPVPLPQWFKAQLLMAFSGKIAGTRWNRLQDVTHYFSAII